MRFYPKAFGNPYKALFLGTLGLLIMASPARAETYLSGTYNCMKVEVAGKTQPCTAPSIELNSDGSYQILAEREPALASFVQSADQLSIVLTGLATGNVNVTCTVSNADGTTAVSAPLAVPVTAGGTTVVNITGVTLAVVPNAAARKR